MAMKYVFASVALVSGLASAQSPGAATVINNCDYTVYLANTPSADGVHQTESAVLSPGQTYTQTYTALDNNNGWSIKLAQSSSFPSDATFQYEYTYQSEDTVWFDMSNVNNQLWSLVTDITSTNCVCDSTLRQVAYMSPDDNAAMQTNCSSSADVTVAICQIPGSTTCGGSSSSAASPVHSSVAQSSAYVAPSSAPATTEAAAAPTTTQAPPAPLSTSAEPIVIGTQQSGGPFVPAFSANHNHQADVVSAAPTTLATSTVAVSSATPALEDVDGNVEVVWYTNVVTEHVTFTTTQDGVATPAAKRHEHHAHGHAH